MSPVCSLTSDRTSVKPTNLRESSPKTSANASRSLAAQGAVGVLPHRDVVVHVDGAPREAVGEKARHEQRQVAKAAQLRALAAPPLLRARVSLERERLRVASEALARVGADELAEQIDEVVGGQIARRDVLARERRVEKFLEVRRPATARAEADSPSALLVRPRRRRARSAGARRRRTRWNCNSYSGFRPGPGERRANWGRAHDRGIIARRLQWPEARRNVIRSAQAEVGQCRTPGTWHVARAPELVV